MKNQRERKQIVKAIASIEATWRMLNAKLASMEGTLVVPFRERKRPIPPGTNVEKMYKLLVKAPAPLRAMEIARRLDLDPHNVYSSLSNRRYFRPVAYGLYTANKDLL